MDTPLVDKRYLLQKFPGKGGWTYAAIPEVMQDKHAPFGWVRVKGFIDDYEVKDYKLMPMGNGQLFLPVKAEIRKRINKREGDWVHVTLYPGNTPTAIPDEFLECLQEVPKAFTYFHDLTDGQRKEFVDWIYAAKTNETKIERITKALDKLGKGEKLRDKEAKT